MDRQAPRKIEQPEEGYYATRLVPRGPEVPVELRLLQGYWIAALNGIPQGEAYPDADIPDLVAGAMVLGEMFSHPFVRILTFARRISVDEYDAMLDAIEWAKVHRPDDPRLNPTQPIDLTKIKSLW